MANKRRACCPPKPTLEVRPLLDPEVSNELAEFFKVLANGTRLRMLHALARDGELTSGDIARAIGMLPQAVSNQLQRLAELGIVEGRRSGSNVFYRIADPCVLVLLDRGLCLME